MPLIQYPFRPTSRSAPFASSAHREPEHGIQPPSSCCSNSYGLAVEHGHGRNVFCPAWTHSARPGGPPPAMTPEQDTSVREPRNYPEQPPVIPHSTEGYEVSINANKCLSCHARTRVRESQAPMISVTHFSDRDGQFLASISPRRYFCTQCHVPQHNVRIPVDNDFVDIDTVLKGVGPGAPR